MGPVVLDASVLIGLLDTADAHHERAITDVERLDRDGRRLLTAASAYSETLVAFARVDRIPDARSALRSMGIAVVPLGDAEAEDAATLRATYSALRLPDALVLATARRQGATLLAYDDRLRRTAHNVGVAGNSPPR
ncbi:MAG: type II toxin-antitoxin system VapC family toxin [Solirubrobacteraceae bacterium]